MPVFLGMLVALVMWLFFGETAEFLVFGLLWAFFYPLIYLAYITYFEDYAPYMHLAYTIHTPSIHDRYTMQGVSGDKGGGENQPPVEGGRMPSEEDKISEKEGEER